MSVNLNPPLTPPAAPPPARPTASAREAMRLRASEIRPRLAAIRDFAADQRMTLTAALEREDESDSEERRSGMDAFSRQLREAKLITQSDPVEGAYYADPLSRFAEGENPILFGEWCRRQWNRAQNTARVLTGQRAAPEFLSSDYLPGSIMAPYADAPGVRQLQVQPAIPLSEVVAVTTQITGTVDYRTLHLVEPSAAAVRLFRVVEAAELPRTRISLASQAIRLKKYGRAIEASYELLRRQRIDQIALLLQRIAVQSQIDQVATVMDVMLNGDGNSGTSATNYNLTTLDPAAVAGTLTAKGWLAFRMKFLNPYMMTHALAQSDVSLQLQLLTLPNNNIPLVTPYLGGLGAGFVPINQSLAGGIRLGTTSDAPSLKIIGFDARFGIERVVETGSLINEAERWILRQVEVMTMSMEEGYCVYDANAVRTLNVNA